MSNPDQISLCTTSFELAVDKYGGDTDYQEPTRSD